MYYNFLDGGKKSGFIIYDIIFHLSARRLWFFRFAKKRIAESGGDIECDGSWRFWRLEAR